MIPLDSKSFNYKSKITGSLKALESLEVKTFVPLKHLSNFWRTVNMPLINYEINLILTWSENCVKTRKVTRDANPDAHSAIVKINNPTNATFEITDTKLYMPVVILSTETDNNLLVQLKTVFKRTMNWNKYRSEVTKQTKTNNLNYLTDPTFNKVNRLFVLPFENKDDRKSFSKYYTLSIEIKNFNVLIDGIRFFDVPIKKAKKNHKKFFFEMSKNNDHKTDNLLDYQYFSKSYKQITTDLSKQTELDNGDLGQQLILLVNLKEILEQQCFSSLKNQKEQLLNFYKIL